MSDAITPVANGPYCPACSALVDGRASACPQCAVALTITALCPTCEQPLERLKACGAVDYFCSACNALVSKRALHWQVRA
ncbi:MAG: zinc ribbon domain-containing protein [Aeromonas sp.]